MPIRSVTLRVLGDSKDALTKLKLVNAEADKLEKRKVNVHVGVDIDNNDIVAVKAKIAAISKLRASIGIKIDTQGLLADFAKIKAEMAALRDLSKQVKIDPGVDIRALMTATNELKKMGLSADNSGASLRRLGKDAKNVDSIMGSIFKRGNSGFYSFFSFLTGDVKLFAGLLGTISTFHLLFDAILEVAIVWTTAAAAATAFGIAAAPTVDKIYDHMKNLLTVSKATGQNIPPLTGAFRNLANAVKPQVYQIFGDALTVLNSRTGLFSKLAVEAGGVLEHFAARIAVALRTGRGLGDFLDQATHNLAGLLSGFADFFHIIGSLMSVMPGYAEILLGFGDAFLHITAIVVNAAKPFIGAGLWIHGFIVWAGLGATITWAFGHALIFFGDKAIGTAIKGIISAGIAAGGMAGEFSILTAVVGTFEATWATLTAISPWIWIGAAVGALIGLTLWMGKSTNATQKWGDALQKGIDNAKSIAEGIQRTNQAASLSSARLAEAQIKLSRTSEDLAISNKGTRFEAVSVSRAWDDQAIKTAEARDQAARFNKEAEQSNTRLNALSRAYHGQGNAMALVAAAGITEQEWQDHSASGWAIIKQRIDATIAGYQAMGQTGGTLNNDLAVMDRSIDTQREAMQKLNQAWDSFISDVTGTQTSFDAVATGFKTLETQGVKTTASLGKTHFTVEGLGKALDGLTPKDIALNQAFSTQVGQLNTLFDSWRNAGLSANFFTSGVKAGIEPLVKYAKGSKEGTAQLVALAQEAGYSGPNSLKELIKWLGHTHDSTQTLKKVTNQATTQEALLTGAMQAQGSYIANTLLRDIAQAELAYSGARGAAKAYGAAIAEYGKNSVEANAKQKILTDTIINAGVKTHSTVGQMAALITKLTGIPKNVAIRIVETGVGSFGITGAPGHELPHHRPGSNAPFASAAGRYINVGTTPTADDVLSRVSRGELIVPTHLVNSGAVDHLRGKIPGFAGGGWPQMGPAGVFSGQSAVNFNQKFIDTFTSAMENAMSRAWKAAEARQKSMMLSGSGALGGDEAANRALAQRLFPWPASMWPAFVDLEMHEAGFNRFARNRTSGAYGIPQALPPTKMPFAAQAAGGSHAGAQLGWMFGYISSTYGNPLVADAHEHSHNWYAKGTGGAKPGLAVVGERGPELIDLMGGERIWDAVSTKIMLRGYASGTEGRRGAELINIFRNDQSDKSWRRDLHKYLEFINDYYNGRAKNWRDDHIIRQTKAMERAQDELGKVNAMAKSYNQYRSAAFQSLSGYGGLSNLTVGPTAGTGDNVPLSGGQSLGLQLNTRLATLKQFNAALRKLVQLKLPPSLLRQIVDMGPDSGLPLAQEIISGGASFVRALSGKEAAITEQERQISRGVGAASVGRAFDTGTDFINGLRRHRRDLEDLFSDLGKRMGREAVRWFNVPKKRRPKGFAAGGVLMEPVWGLGVSGAEYTFAEHGPELITPGRMPNGRGGDVYNITVAGDSDPDGAARRIIQKVSDYKRRHGGRSTGIG